MSKCPGRGRHLNLTLDQKAGFKIYKTNIWIYQFGADYGNIMFELMKLIYTPIKTRVTMKIHKHFPIYLPPHTSHHNSQFTHGIIFVLHTGIYYLILILDKLRLKFLVFGCFFFFFQYYVSFNFKPYN